MKMLYIFLIGVLRALLNGTAREKGGLKRDRRIRFDNVPVQFIFQGSGKGKPTRNNSTNRRNIQFTESEIVAKQAEAEEALQKAFEAARELHDELLIDEGVESGNRSEAIDNIQVAKEKLPWETYPQVVPKDTIKVDEKKARESFLDALREHQRRKKQFRFHNQGMVF